jgi:hypothetical protein
MVVGDSAGNGGGGLEKRVGNVEEREGGGLVVAADGAGVEEGRLRHHSCVTAERVPVRMGVAVGEVDGDCGV